MAGADPALERAVDEVVVGLVAVGAGGLAELCSLLVVAPTPQPESAMAASAGPSAKTRAARGCGPLGVCASFMQVVSSGPSAALPQLMVAVSEDGKRSGLPMKMAWAAGVLLAIARGRGPYTGTGSGHPRDAQ